MRGETAQLCALSAAVVLVFVASTSGGAGLVRAENRGSGPSTVHPRKPPFNGSIFGKRSVWSSNPELNGGSGGYYNGGGVGSGGATNSYQQQQTDQTLPLGDALNLLVQQQQEALVRATINHCYNMQQASETELALCASLMGSPRKTPETGTWFTQLASM